MHELHLVERAALQYRLRVLNSARVNGPQMPDTHSSACLLKYSFCLVKQAEATCRQPCQFLPSYRSSQIAEGKFNSPDVLACATTGILTDRTGLWSSGVQRPPPSVP